MSGWSFLLLLDRFLISSRIRHENVFFLSQTYKNEVRQKEGSSTFPISLTDYMCLCMCVCARVKCRLLDRRLWFISSKITKVIGWVRFNGDVMCWEKSHEELDVNIAFITNEAHCPSRQHKATPHSHSRSSCTSGRSKSLILLALICIPFLILSFPLPTGCDEHDRIICPNIM